MLQKLLFYRIKLVIAINLNNFMFMSSEEFSNRRNSLFEEDICDCFDRNRVYCAERADIFKYVSFYGCNVTASNVYDFMLCVIRGVSRSFKLEKFVGSSGYLRLLLRQKLNLFCGKGHILRNCCFIR